MPESYELRERKVSLSIDVAPQPSSSKPTSFDGSHDDVEKGVGTTTELKRRLKSRHLQMIAIGMPQRAFVIPNMSDRA